jgi:hypothetical protein
MMLAAPMARELAASMARELASMVLAAPPELWHEQPT